MSDHPVLGSQARRQSFISAHKQLNDLRGSKRFSLETFEKIDYLVGSRHQSSEKPTALNSTLAQAASLSTWNLELCTTTNNPINLMGEFVGLHEQ